MENNTFGQQLKEYMGDMSANELSSESTVSSGYLSELLNDYKKDKTHRKTPSVSTINKIAKALYLNNQQKDILLAKSGHLQLERTKLDSFTLNVEATLSSEQIPDEIKQHIKEDIATVIKGWTTYVDVKRNQYYQDWENTVERCQKTSDQVNQTVTDLVTYLQDLEAVAQLHLGKPRYAEAILNQLELSLGNVDFHQIDEDKTDTSHKLREKLLQKASVLVHQGDVYRDKGQFQEAAKKYEQAANGYKYIKSTQKMAEANRKKALTYLFRGEAEKAHVILDGCLHEFVSGENPVELIKTYYAFGWTYNLLGAWEQAEKAHRAGIDLTEQYNEHYKQLDNFGQVKEEGQTFSNVPWEQNCLLMSGYTYLGYDYMQTGKYSESRSMFYKAHGISQKLKEQRERGWILLGLARLAYYEGQKHQQAGNIKDATVWYNEAGRYFQEAENSHENTRFNFRWAISLIQHGKFLLRVRKDIVGAEEKLNTARGIVQDLKSSYYLSKANLYLCELYMQKDGVVGNKELSNLCVQLEDELDLNKSKYLATHLWVTKAAIVLYQHQYDEAALCFSEAFYSAIAFNPQVVNKVKRHLYKSVLEITKSGTPKAEKIVMFLHKLIDKLDKQSETKLLLDAYSKEEVKKIVRQLKKLSDDMRRLSIDRAIERATSN